jgi:hypothetical protein
MLQVLSQLNPALLLQASMQNNVMLGTAPGNSYVPPIPQQENSFQMTSTLLDHAQHLAGSQPGSEVSSVSRENAAGSTTETSPSDDANLRPHPSLKRSHDERECTTLKKKRETEWSMQKIDSQNLPTGRGVGNIMASFLEDVQFEESSESDRN